MIENIEVYLPSIFISLGIAIMLYYFILSNPRKVEDISVGLMKETKEDVSQSNDCILNPAVFRPFKITKITQVSHNTKLFRFEIPSNKSLGLGIGRHISVRANINGNNVIRAYTPTSHPNQEGYFDLLIKAYEMGKLTPYLHALSVGDSVEVRGPVGRFKYVKNKVARMGLIAGGTGLTPCLQLVRCVLSEDYQDDKTSFVLLYQNRTEEDILLRKELDKIVRSHSDRFQVIYFLSNPLTPAFGNASDERRGYITLDAMHEYVNFMKCPYVGICGPSGFNDAMRAMLKKVGHTTDDSVFVW